MASLFGRKVVGYKVNKSGGGVVSGDVLVPDTTNDNAFTTTTSAAVVTGVWIADETIASNATGRVVLSGHVTLVNVSASVTRGHTGTTHTVAKQAVSTGGTTRTTGTFCKFTTGGTTPEADIWPVDLLGSSLTNPMTTAGDIIVGGAAGAPARLAAGTAGYPLVGGGAGVASAYAVAANFHGYRGYNAGSVQTLTTSVWVGLIQDTEAYDTDAYHFTSSAALTGTVTKTASSAAIVGSSTLFTSELSVNQIITIPGTAIEYGVVKQITDNTHLTLWTNMANSASGQTATRYSGGVAIPVGLAGYYFMEGAGTFAASSAGNRFLAAYLNDTTGPGTGTRILDNQFGNPAATPNQVLTLSGPYHLAEGDFVNFVIQQSTGGNLNTVNFSVLEPHFSISLLGI